MKTTVTASPDELVGALDGLGLHLLSGGVVPKRLISPAELLAGLVRQPDARLSLAIIPLLLYRPDFASALLDASAIDIQKKIWVRSNDARSSGTAETPYVVISCPAGTTVQKDYLNIYSLSGNDLLTLKLYYTAAMLLQEKYKSQLTPLLGQQKALPDLFSTELALSGTGSVEGRLREVGERHESLVEAGVNWVGTYHHGAKRLIKRLECEMKWGLR